MMTNRIVTANRGAFVRTGQVLAATLLVVILATGASHAQIPANTPKAATTAADFASLPAGPLPATLYRYGFEPRVVQEPPLTRLSAPPPPAVTTAAEGERVSRLATTFVGVSSFKVGGTDLARGIDNASFVSQIFKLAGVSVPEPPVENMMLFGEMVHWSGGKAIALPGLSASLPDCPHSLDALQPGDRIFFQRDSDTSKGPTMRVSTGIYVGKYRDIAHGVALCADWKQRATILDLDAPENREMYVFALRGWTYRAPLNGSIVPGKALPPASDKGRTYIVYKERDANGTLSVAGESGTFREVRVTAAQYFQQPVQPQGRVRIIAVGIDDYPGQPTFHTADNSRRARAVYQSFIELYGAGRCDFSESRVLTSEKVTGPKAYPTRDVVEAAIRRAAESSSANDILVVYLAGYGSGDRLHTMESGMDDGKDQGVSLTSLLDELAVSAQRKLILLADYDSVEVPKSAADRMADTGKEVVVIASTGPTETRTPDADLTEKVEATFKSLTGSDVPTKEPVTVETLFARLRARLPGVATYSPAPKNVFLLPLPQKEKEKSP